MTVDPNPEAADQTARATLTSRAAFIALSVSLLLLLIGNSAAQMGQGPQFGSGGGGHRHGLHDEMTMPGLMGLNASQRESDELAIMFRAFETLTRTVDNLPNGIRTATRSSDQEVMGALASHVVGMIDRVERGDDPQIMIQSPTLDVFFVRGEAIHTEIDFTDEGIIVIQTSDDPQVVEALQTHAAEVSAMADRGMQAVHEMMMQRGQ